MDCKKVRDMLLTDYLDNELDSQRMVEVDRHLNGCSACREVLEAARAVTLKGGRAFEPDPAVWQGIHERIGAAVNTQHGWLGKIGDALASLLTMPRLALGASFVTALVLFAVLFLKGPSVNGGAAYAYLEEQMTFMDGLRSGEGEVSSGDLNGYAVILED